MKKKEEEGFTCRLQLFPAQYKPPSSVIQPACFVPGFYIEMALSYHQPHQHELVGGWKLIFGEKRAIAGRFSINPDDSKG